MPDPIQATPPSGPSASPSPAAAPPSGSAIPAAIPDRGSALPNHQGVIPAGEQAPPAGSTARESEAPSALIPGSGGNGTGGPPVPVDWRATLPAELKKETSLGAINSVEDLAKSYVHAQKLLGGPKISVPDPKLATPEDYRVVFEKLGLPKEQKDYTVEIPKEGGLDPEFAKQFTEAAFKAGVLPKHAQELMNWYAEASKGILGNLQEQSQKQLADGHKALHEEWGNAYDRKILATQLVVKDFADDETIGWLKESGLHQNPKFLKFMSRIGETLKEPELKGGAGRGTFQKTPAEANAEANRIIADMTHPYNVASHPNHQAAVDEVNSLFQMANPEPQSDEK